MSNDDGTDGSDEHEHWNFSPIFVTPPDYLSESVQEHVEDPVEDPDAYSDLYESICGATDDSQNVEQYDGTLGVTTSFVDTHQSPVGQLQWNGDLASIYDDPGNVSGVRWCTGTLLSNDLFLTAGHCFDQNADDWILPKIDGTPVTIPPPEIATNMHVNFNYQLDPSGNLRPEQEFDIVELVEYRRGGLDFAIVRLDGNPGSTFGTATFSLTDPSPGDTLCLISHPEGVPKRIEAGALYHLHDNRVGYNDIDTLGGSSGAGVLDEQSGKIVGVHTHGGCNFAMTGHNHGFRITSIVDESPTLQSLRVPQLVVDNFGYDAGGWRVDRHPRFLADLTGDGAADIAGFGYAGMYTALNNGDGTFQGVNRVVDNFGYDAGGWRVDSHPRFLADLTRDGTADIVGFGNAGVYVALNNGDGTFQGVNRVVDNFGYDAGGWRIDSHPRFLADLTGDGADDIVGFGNAGVYVALNSGNGTF